jgi:hypothetical protein
MGEGRCKKNRVSSINDRGVVVLNDGGGGGNMRKRNNPDKKL